MKKGLERDLNGYKSIIKISTSKAEKAGSEMFSLYGTLLSEEKRLQWEGWVKDMTETDPWTDLHGKAQEGPVHLGAFAGAFQHLGQGAHRAHGLDHVVQAHGRAQRHFAGRQRLQPDVAGGDAGTGGGGHEGQQAVDGAPHPTLRRVQAADQENKTQGREGDALQDAQRARHHQHAELHVQRVGQQRRAQRETGQELGAESPGEGIGGHGVGFAFELEGEWIQPAAANTHSPI